jgi:hypothetical protein
MTKSKEQIHVKCDYCGEMFTTPREHLDVPVHVTAITSQFNISLEFPHPELRGVSCHYCVGANKGDYCMKCCILFLENGLIKLSEQVNNGEIKLDL